jgi:Cof subfamily protein (haloacid dehalogenase superfamily)
LQYRLIALDLDGTTLNRRQQITPRTRETLRSARERGILTVIVTGRTPQSARYWNQVVGGGPLICCNGAGIIDASGTFLVTKGLPKAEVSAIVQVCTSADVLVECYTTNGIVLDRPMRQLRAHLQSVRLTRTLYQGIVSAIEMWRFNRIRAVRNLSRWLERGGIPPILKVMIIAEPTQLSGIKERLMRTLPGVGITSSAHNNLEIMAAGVTKASGLQALGAHLQIPPESMIAFGDSDNDLEMLSYAGIGVAMGNASDSVKAVANKVAPSCDEDGVARVIEELCLS